MGLQGPAGATGPAGSTGALGATGPQGSQGERGFGLPQRGNISVSFAAFVADYNQNASYHYDYEFGFSRPLGALRNLNTGTTLFCYAPLQLPHGATITNATFYFYDNDDNYFVFYLTRGNTTTLFTDIDGINNAPGSDTPGWTHVSLDNINPSYATVDNNNYSYWLEIQMPWSSNYMNYRFKYALVEYEYPA